MRTSRLSCRLSAHKWLFVCWQSIKVDGVFEAYVHQQHKLYAVNYYRYGYFMTVENGLIIDWAQTCRSYVAIPHVVFDFLKLSVEGCLWDIWCSLRWEDNWLIYLYPMYVDMSCLFTCLWFILSLWLCRPINCKLFVLKSKFIFHAADICQAPNCNKLKLKHSGAPTQQHDYCSLNCLKSDYVARSKSKSTPHTFMRCGPFCQNATSW